MDFKGTKFNLCILIGQFHRATEKIYLNLAHDKMLSKELLCFSDRQWQ